MASWSKGFTKDTHPSVRKISDTMRLRKIDNFRAWRDQAILDGRIKTKFPSLKRTGDLAEFIGVVLGDGHIEKFPRTERLLIFSNARNRGFVERYARLVESIFEKKPYIYKQSNQNCIRISMYEKNISKRLGIPCGARRGHEFTVPNWIRARRIFIIRYLRGLYEAEGSHSEHAGTYTYKLSFANTNQSILKNVFELLTVLGFSPHQDTRRVQISRKNDVLKAVRLLEFRKY